MQVHHGIQSLPSFKNAIVTMGTFDGVHAGHRSIIKRITNLAKLKDGESVLITFEPHPRFLLQPNHPIKLLNTPSEKIKLLEGLGIDHLVIVAFTLDFAQQEPKNYIEHFLIHHFNPAVVVIGYDHQFGKGRKGDFNLLQSYADQGLFELEEISKQEVDEIHVSSTSIRTALANGNVEEANLLLQSTFSLEGKVVQGKQNGRKIGWPTANLDVENSHKLIPKNGVYAAYANCGSEQYQAIVNIGVRPTISDAKNISIEAHLLDISLDMYGKTIRLEFLHRIRDEQKFENMEALQQQISLDKSSALLLFNKD